MSKPSKPSSSLPLKKKILAPSSRPTNSAAAGPSRPKLKGATGDAFDDDLFMVGIKDESGRVKEFFSEDDKCPICLTDRFSNPKLRLLISPCFHKLCEACVDRLFAHSSNPCPTPGCPKIIRKTNFIHQTFESLEVEKEVGIRKRMNGIYNKTLADFDSEKEYNDYLEEVEDLTFNLIEGIDLPQTNAKIQSYLAANSQISSLRASQSLAQSSSQTQTDAALIAARLQRQAEVEAEEAAERKEKDEERRDILDAMAEVARRRKGGVKGGDEDADSVVRRVQEKRRRDKERKERGEAGKVRKRAGQGMVVAGAVPETDLRSPQSPSYTGPFVPFPYSPPVLIPELVVSNGDDKNPYAAKGKLKFRYVDVTDSARVVKADGVAGRFRAGGVDLEQGWARDLGDAMESLWVEPPV